MARNDSSPELADVPATVPAEDRDQAAIDRAPSVERSGRFDLGHGEMDGIHREFIVLVDALARSPDTEVAVRLDALIEHTRHHFERETTWMQLSAFPPIHCHEAEHARVMEVAATVRERVAAGEHELGRTLAAGLAEWFEIHADTMDRVLAHWLARGAPPADRGC